MKKLTKLLALALVFIMLFSMLATSLIGCGGNGDDTSSDTSGDSSSDTGKDTSSDTNKPDDSSKNVNYTVQIKTVGGMAVSGVTLAVTLDGNIKDFGNTDKDGKITFTYLRVTNITLP